MEVSLNTKVYNVSNNNRSIKNNTATKNQPSFKGSEHLTPEQADALKSQYIAAQNMNKQSKIPHITEKDINLQVTCVGCNDADGNTRKLIDFRQAMDRAFPNWKEGFYIPHVVRNGNGDEKYNGETTAIAIPLHPDTKGVRGGDHAVIVFNGNIPKDTINELVNYMIKTKILKQAVYGTAHKQWCHLNSDNPKWFFNKTNIKTVLANFFRQKAVQQAQETSKTEQKEQTSQQIPITESDINIRNYDEQDKHNTREVKDYRKYFVKNNRNFTVGTAVVEENGIEKPMTIILIPTKENTDNCVVVTIDNRKLTKQQAEDLFNYLRYNNITNSEDEMFRKAIVNYLNK